MRAYVPRAPEVTPHAERLDEAADVLGAWLDAGPDDISPVAGGSLNWNFAVSVGEQRLFLRCYRDSLETERILGEHDLLRWVLARGTPAPEPIATRDGRTLVEVGPRRWSLAPWMPGAPVARGTFSPAQARSLGAAHGRLQALLATHAPSPGRAVAMRWDRDQSLAALAHLVKIAIERREEEWIVAALQRQRELLEGWDVWPPERYAALPSQLLHGDFHDQQVLFDGDTVTAIVDWEIWHTDPRAWELVRSLSFSKMLDSRLLEDYVRGYREHVRLGEEEARMAMHLWFQSRVVGLWAWWAYVMEGNQRVRDFFPEMIAELERVADDGWKSAVTERLVRAAC